MNPAKLFEKYSLAELQEIQSKLMNDPANRNADKDSIFIYNKRTRDKLRDIDWAIFHHLQNKRK